MTSDHSKININFEQLGKSFRTYGFASVFIAIIVFVVTFIATMGAVFSITTPQGLISFANTMKGVTIAALVFSLIESVFFVYLIYNIRQSVASRGRFSETLQKVYILLALSMIIQIVIGIFSSIYGFQVLEELITLIGTMSLEELVSMGSTLDSSSLLINALNLIPLGISLAGYMKLKDFGSEIGLTLPRSESTNKVKRGCEFLSYAAIIAIILGLLNLIPIDLSLLTGGAGLAQLILFYMGLFKTGSGLIELFPQISMNIPSGSYASEKNIQEFSSDLDGSFKICTQCGSRQPSGEFCGKCGSKL